MRTVGELLQAKGREVHGIDREATIPRAALALHDHGVGALMVYDVGRPVGIFTWHDLIRAVAMHGEDLSERRVSDFMTSELVMTSEDKPFAEIEAEMLRNHVRHVPVAQNGDVVGMLGLVDVLRARLAEADALGEELEAYLQGTYPH